MYSQLKNIAIILLSVSLITALAAVVSAEESQSSKELIARMVREKRIREQHERTLSEHQLGVGKRLYNEMRYREARQEFQTALMRDPDNSEAQEFLRKTEAILGIGRRSEYFMGRLRRQQRVRTQQMLVELKAAMKKGQRLMDEGRYEQAIKEFQHALDIIELAPPEMKIKTNKHQKEFSSELENSTRLRNAQAALEDSLKRTAAGEKAAEEVAKRRELLALQVEVLLKRALDAYENEEYDKAIAACESILKLDVQNEYAKALREGSQAERHAAKMTNIRGETQLGAPEDRIVKYPKEWGNISRRVSNVFHTAEKSVSWEGDIERKLDQRVTFDFDATRLDEVLSFIQELTEINIILDPMAREGENVRDIPVTLNVKDMKLRNAFAWILRIADLAYVMSDEAIFVTSLDKVQQERILVAYDVRDLLGGIRNYHGPRIAFGSLNLSGDGAGAEWEQPEDDDTTTGGRFETGEDLAEFIRDVLNLDDGVE